MDVSIKKFIPWWIKICAKITLTRIPIKYSFWSKLKLFKHGQMDNIKYAFDIFNKHYIKNQVSLKRDFSICELGPGDSAYTAFFAYLYGARKTYLIDNGFFIDMDAKVPISDIYEFAKNRKRDFLLLENLNTNNKNLLKEINTEYLSGGLNEYSLIPDESIDFLFSNAVLEHVSLKEFEDTLKNVFRIMNRGSICSHTVDLRDHLQCGLNNLRFSKKVWESDLFAKSGFYTNRLRYSQMIEYFRKVGFEIVEVSTKKFPTLPISKNKLSREFKNIQKKDLLIEVFDIVMIKP
ncbi:MAG: class I SAM-dependent methyltransferase [Clostridiales bacterium]